MSEKKQWGLSGDFDEKSVLTSQSNSAMLSVKIVIRRINHKSDDGRVS